MSHKKTKISDFGEKKLITRIIKKTRHLQSDYFSNDLRIMNSLGDDAALIDFGSNYLVASSDMLIETSHFPKQMKAREIGWKIVTVNISDLAAMGAYPMGFLVSMGLPKEMDIDFFDEMVNGILEACKYYNLPLIGGDTNESPQLVLNGTALGEVNKKKVLMKSEAEKGDLLAVTGPLGLAAAGFEYLLSENYPEIKSEKSKNSENLKKTLRLVTKHAFKPKARLNEGILATQFDQIKGATDITDGLVSELEEIINASKNSDMNSQSYIGIKIYENKIPIPPEVIEIADLFNKNPLDMALYYGEDFELLFVIKKDGIDEIKEHLNLHVLGEVTSTGFMEIVKRKGITEILPSGGYQHFID